MGASVTVALRHVRMSWKTDAHLQNRAVRADHSDVRRVQAVIGSLAVRLILVALVPLIALGVVADRRVDDQRHDRDHAQALVELIELRRTVTRVYAPKNLERIALEALARVDQLGYPRSLVVTSSGYDFEAIEAENRRQFDAALDDLENRFGDVPTVSGASLGDELATIRRDLDTAAAALDRNEAEPAAIAGIFTRLDAVLADALASDHVMGDHAHDDVMLDGRSDLEQLGPLAVVLDTAGKRGKALLQSFIYESSPGRATRAIRADAHHEQATAYYRSVLSPDERAEFDTLTAQLQPVPLEILDQVDGFSLDTFDVALIRSIAVLLQNHNEYMRDLADHSDAVHAKLQADAEATAVRATADLERTRFVLIGVIGLTLVLVALVMVTTLVPVRRLTRRAESISAGDIDPNPLPVRGTSDIRALTRTTNEMTALLAEVESEIRRMADSDDDQHPVDLPGTLGASLQGSMHRLQTITAQLLRSEQLASAIVARAGDAIWSIDAAGTIQTANDASQRLTGVPEELQTGRPIDDFLTGLSGSRSMRSVDGAEWSVLVSSSTIDTGAEPVTVVIAHDISDRLEFERQLGVQARRDPLTSLPNRLAVVERLRELVESGSSAAVLYVDLDGFKGVNDLRGHGTGDEVLREVARRLRAAVPEPDIVGRLGGDEFIVVSTRLIDPVSATELGGHLIAAAEAPFNTEDLIKLSASVGVVMLDRQESAEVVLSEADSALYQAKHRGKGRTEVFDRELQVAVANEVEIELALRRAIPAGELALHLQPIIDLRTGLIDGAEALVRWNRPGYGLVQPGEFISIAERSSLIIELDRWVIERCCERLASWRSHHADGPLRLAVNISGRHLMEGNLVDDVAAALARTGADPTMLEVELTETHLLGDLDRAVASLTSLRERGVRVSIDDFGTGYSAMNHLRQLPIDSIKIDRSFVAAASASATDASVVDAVLAIGRSHGLEVVAEGIETEDHLDFVRTRGCNRAQGYLIARPIPADEAELVIFGFAAAPVA